MEFHAVASQSTPRLTVKVAQKDKAVSTFAGDVAEGLSQQPKVLHPKYFYDERGSQLFEEICELPEYYPTRTEQQILQEYAEEMAVLVPSDLDLVELGSGSSIKTQLLIEAFLKRQQPLHYIPIDISKSILVESAKALLEEYRHLHITALAADYVTALHTLQQSNANRKLIVFLGSSIGNFGADEQTEFLKQIRETMTLADRFLLGTDLIKDEAILIPAYDDARGVTAAFNKNILQRMNDELGADFDLDLFRHKAVFNREHSRVEMHLESLANQSVSIDALNRSFRFAKGETIHTENSYKFSRERIKKLAAASGFRVSHAWQDDKNWFSLNLLKPI